MNRKTEVITRCDLTNSQALKVKEGKNILYEGAIRSKNPATQNTDIFNVP